MVLKSPSRKFLKGVKKLMAAPWINSRPAPPTCFSVSPHFIRALPRGGGGVVEDTNLEKKSQWNGQKIGFGKIQTWNLEKNESFCHCILDPFYNQASGGGWGQT